MQQSTSLLWRGKCNSHAETVCTHTERGMYSLSSLRLCAYFVIYLHYVATRTDDSDDSVATKQTQPPAIHFTIVCK